MRKLVAGLEWSPPQGVWVAYGERNSYTDDDAKRKDEFVREVATSQRWGLTWDIGCNNGRYSRIAAEGSDHVLAVDADQGPIELLYRSLRDEGDEKMLTLTMNLADPSPGLGWRGVERKPLRRPRQARPGAGAGADPPRDDRRQRAGGRVRRLAGLAGAPRW